MLLGSDIEIGCWLDCTRGIYIGEKVQEIAGAYGWNGPAVNIDDEFYHEVTDEAIDYLNDCLAAHPEADNLYFGFNHNGDFGIWEHEDAPWNEGGV